MSSPGAATNFWAKTSRVSRDYTDAPFDATRLADIEARLGFRLPASYVALLSVQNGGVPARRFLVPAGGTPDDVVEVSGIFGIGDSAPLSLLGAHGSTFMQREWGYPTWGICIADTPVAGHEVVMLDYRDCGPQGEPTVVIVDQEAEWHVTPLAPDFASFIAALQKKAPPLEVFSGGTRAREVCERGRFSSSLEGFLSASDDLTEAEFRSLLVAVVRTKKGELALHGDPLSWLVYDALFLLYSRSTHSADPQRFLNWFPGLIVFGDGEVKTHGYAPGFIASWLEARQAEGTITVRDGRLRFTDAFRDEVIAQVRAAGTTAGKAKPGKKAPKDR